MRFPHFPHNEIPYFLRSLKQPRFHHADQNPALNVPKESNVFIQEFLSKKKENPPLKSPQVTKISGIPVPTIQNIVCTVNLCCKLNLKEITLKAKNAEYNPRRFSALIMRIRSPKTTALIFSSGKIVCTGAKTESQAKTATRIFGRIIQKLGFNIRLKDFQIQNVVGSCDTGIRPNLTALHSKLDPCSGYEPEVFPAVIYKMAKPRVINLIFNSGKVILTGAKHKSEIDEAFENIYPIIKMCEPNFEKTTKK